ncbi:MAG: phytanoyl-CoA dioxygenase family protein [Alphaproteobacteria bacterium]|nr:phytanoyl-CoA dioxygenase family protein [Alphaproteobacteria bacterium]
MGTALSAAEVAAYHERGYHLKVNAFSVDEANAFNRRFEESEKRAGASLSTGLLNMKPHLVFPWLDAIVRDARILDAVESILGPDLLCFSSGFFNKGPGDGTYVSWHQDATYWGLAAPEVVTAWVAFAPSNELSGCMRVVPGSHLTQLKHHDTFAEKNLLTRGQEVEAKVDESQAVDFVLEPGEVSLHHVLIVHGSGPNRASWPRRGFAIRYMPTSLKPAEGRSSSALLVRGVDRFKYHLAEVSPEAELHPDAVARHKALVEHSLKGLYQTADKAIPGARLA